MANPRYKIVNASNEVFSAATSKGHGLVQPSTRRVLELDEEISDRRIESLASSGIFIKKTNEAAQNEEPLPGLDETLALARNRLMLVAGQERDDLIASLWDEGGTKAKASAAKVTTGGASAAPSTTPAAQGATATAAPAASAGNTSTVGS